MANTTYDWQPHMAKIVQMYLDGKSVSEIHIAIQDPGNGFTPKPRIVYNVLKKHGYPTKPKKREAFLQLRAQNSLPHHGHDLGAITWPSTTLRSNSTPQSIYVASPNPSESVSTAQDHATPFTGNLHYDAGQKEFDNQTCTAHEASQIPNMNHNSCPDEDPKDLLTWLCDDVTVPDYIADVGTHYPSLSPGSIPAHTTPNPVSNGDSITRTVGQAYQSSDNAGLVVPQHSLAVDQISTTDPNHCLPSHTSRKWIYRSPSKTRSSAYNTASVSSRANSLLLSRFGSVRSASSDKWMSESTRDSGYSSGRNSPFVVLDETITSEQSLQEFKHLHRIPCLLHEPQPITSSTTPDQGRPSKDQYRNIATCSTCLYSAVHNLSWSSKYLKLEVFQAELKLDLYDIPAVDTVGNTALHYAAASGADSDYLISLIQAGVNPYQLNTEGQLFLHCLHPNDDIGTLSLQMLIINLVNILNYLNRMDSNATSASLRWRDNEGRKFLDTLATHIPDHYMKSQLFRLLDNAGYPVSLSEQFSDSPDQTKADKGFTSTQDKQQKAYEILRHALPDRPNYVDPETGDNVLHALAKLKLPEKGSLLQKVKDVASKDVDLNLHNRDRHSPLAAFVQERPCLGPDYEETGATLSKYLDALLWKDSRRRIPNRINVNMRNRAGATALYYAATRARPDSVRSLLEAGANVNACLNVNGYSQSILQATFNARSGCVNNIVKMHLYNEVVSYLQHEGAVADPTIFQERALCANSIRVMPL